MGVSRPIRPAPSVAPPQPAVRLLLDAVEESFFLGDRSIIARLRDRGIAVDKIKLLTPSFLQNLLEQGHLKNLVHILHDVSLGPLAGPVERLFARVDDLMDVHRLTRRVMDRIPTAFRPFIARSAERERVETAWRHFGHYNPYLEVKALPLEKRDVLMQPLQETIKSHPKLLAAVRALEQISPTFARMNIAQRISGGRIPIDFSVGHRGKLRTHQNPDTGQKSIIMGSHQVLARSLWQFAHACGHFIEPPDGFPMPYISPGDDELRVMEIVRLGARVEQALALSFATQVLREVSMADSSFFETEAEPLRLTFRAYFILKEEGLRGLITALIKDNPPQQLEGRPMRYLIDRFSKTPPGGGQPWELPPAPPSFARSSVGLFDSWMNYLQRVEGVFEPKARTISRRLHREMQAACRRPVNGPEDVQVMIRFIDRLNPKILQNTGFHRAHRRGRYDVRVLSQIEMRRERLENTVDVRPDLAAIAFQPGGKLAILIRSGATIGEAAASFVRHVARFAPWGPEADLTGSFKERIRALYGAYARSEFQGLMAARHLMVLGQRCKLELTMDMDDELIDAAAEGYFSFLTAWHDYLANEPNVEERLLAHLGDSLEAK